MVRKYTMPLLILPDIPVRTWRYFDLLDWWVSWVTYGLEKPFALSHAVTCSGFESKLSGTWLAVDRSTRNFLAGGWLLLAVIFINNSLLTSSITAAQKQDGSRLEKLSHICNSKIWFCLLFLCSLTFVFGRTLVEAVSVAQRTWRWRPVALLHTHRHKHKHSSWESSCYPQNRFVFHLTGGWCIFAREPEEKVCVWTYLMPSTVAACSICCRALVNLHAEWLRAV